MIKAKHEDKIKSLKNEIEKLMKTRFWISRELYEKILEELEK